jgi:hypothetical protein
MRIPLNVNPERTEFALLKKRNRILFDKLNII